jgi:hypothetical protein
MKVASIITEKTLSEFEVLRETFELFHSNVEWFLSCDQYCYDHFKNSELKCFLMIESDDCDHNLLDEAKRNNWMKVMMTKFSICKKALTQDDTGVLFLDCDMVFVNPIEQKIQNLFKDKNIDAFICQHMTNNWQNEAKHGLFNAGMFYANSIDFLNAWENLSKRYKELNMYFEQQPLEYIQRNFVTVNLPINYNIGWWRFNIPQTRGRLDLLETVDDKIKFGNFNAVNFHVHTKRDLEYQNFGQFLVDKVISLLEDSQSPAYKKILKLLR